MKQILAWLGQSLRLRKEYERLCEVSGDFAAFFLRERKGAERGGHQKVADHSYPAFEVYLVTTRLWKQHFAANPPRSELERLCP